MCAMTKARRECCAGQGRSAGFTLLEVLIVLTILAAMTAIAAPVLYRHVARVDVEAAARTLASDLRWLRQRSIATQEETSLVLDLERKRYLRSIDNKERKLPAAVIIGFKADRTSQSERLGVATVRFFPDGTATGAEISLSHGQRSYSVRVSWPFGKVTISD